MVYGVPSPVDAHNYIKTTYDTHALTLKDQHVSWLVICHNGMVVEPVKDARESAEIAVWIGRLDLH